MLALIRFLSIPLLGTRTNYPEWVLPVWSAILTDDSFFDDKRKPEDTAILSSNTLYYNFTFVFFSVDGS